MNSGMFSAGTVRSIVCSTMLSTPPAFRPGRLVFVHEVHRHLDVDDRVLRDAEEIDVDQEILHRVDLVVARDGALVLAADFDLEDRGQEAACMQQKRGLLGVERDADGRLLGAVDDGGNLVFTAQCTSGPLAGPIARFGLDNLGRGHSRISRM